MIGGRAMSEYTGTIKSYAETNHPKSDAHSILSLQAKGIEMTESEIWDSLLSKVRNPIFQVDDLRTRLGIVKSTNRGA